MGKSALVLKFVSNIFSAEHDSTVEDHYRRLVIIDDETVVLHIIDSSGIDEAFSGQFLESYVKQCHGFLLVYAINSLLSFESLPEWWKPILEARRRQELDMDTLPLLLVGNKYDLEDERQVSRDQGERLAREWGCSFFEASAKTVDEVFLDIAHQIYRKAHSE